jgi:hypothetical protein
MKLSDGAPLAQTVEMAEAAGLDATVIGAHGGGKLANKAGNLIGARWR